MTCTVIIDGRAYPAEIENGPRVKIAYLIDEADPFAREVLRGTMLEHASGEWLDALRSIIAPETRPDVDAAVREAIEVARALEPAPLNRHERRRLATLRRRGHVA